MILYHITQDMNHNGFFYPDIPYAILPNENESIRRVCTARTIEGCLGSFPGGGINLAETMDEKGDIFKVFRIDTKKLGLSSLLEDEELVVNQYVYDALISGECWILEDFLVPEEDVFYLKVDGYMDECESYFNYLYYETRDSLGLGNEEFEESDEFDPDDMMNSFILFHDLNYQVIDKEQVRVEIGMMREECGIEWS